MKIIVDMAVLVTALITLGACSNQMYSWSYSPINVQYASELNRVNLGMTKQDLVQTIPGLVPRGQTYVGKETVEGLELQHNYWSGVGGSLVEDRLWFYIHNNVLVKWGKPNDWPQQPDLIIEQRLR